MIGSRNQKVRVLVVDDSMLARSFIIKGISAHPGIEVVGFAINAMDAKNKIQQYHPDVVTMDVEMPGMSGIEFLKKYLPANPVPVVLVSSLDIKVFDALEAGAVDFVRKPDGVQKNDAFIASLTRKVIMASTAKVRTAPLAAGAQQVRGNMLGLNPALDRVIIALGASTGGTEATLEVLKQLPPDIPPMVIVQHMPTGFTKMYAERLDKACRMQVREAQDGMPLQRGVALIAPADLQTRVVRTGFKYYVSCQPGERISGHRPSVDALFHSVADNVTCRTVGIIMTGMGQDGAEGLLAMRRKGAYTIGQDKDSSVVYGMPGVAYDIGAVSVQASCGNIAGVLMQYLRGL
jgi:two-component system chemotaxis response regulator CheB